MKRLAGAALVTAIILMSLPACARAFSADGQATQISGYLRGFATYTTLDQTGYAQLETRMRLKLTHEFKGRTRAELAYELAPIWRENAPVPLLQSPYQGFSYRVHDLDSSLTPEDPAPDETLKVEQNLDRAFITHRARTFDLHLGRQPVAFGSARVVNPTDVLAPYPFDTLAKEERVGVDALRLKVPLGVMSELDAGAVFGHEFRRDLSAAFLRIKGNILNTDISAMAMRFRLNRLYGISAARSIMGASAWLEAAHVVTNTTGNDFTSFSIGTDYVFTGKLYGFMEYHHNGAGAGQSRDYAINVFQEAYMDRATSLMGRHYMAPGFSYQATGLMGLAITALINMDDSSALLSPSIEYNLAEDTYIGAGGFIGTGKKASLLSPPTEFGQYPDTGYLSMSRYF